MTPARSVLFLVGLLLVVTGVAMFSIPAACITGGIGLILDALVIGRKL